MSTRVKNTRKSHILHKKSKITKVLLHQIAFVPRFPLGKYEKQLCSVLTCFLWSYGASAGWSAGFYAGSACSSGWNQVDPLTCSNWDRLGARISPHYRDIDHSQQGQLWIIDALLLERSLRAACIFATVIFNGHPSSQEERNYKLHVSQKAVGQISLGLMN